jgi:uncharacterized protein with von Willebrand factor type A (vWA) domain
MRYRYTKFDPRDLAQLNFRQLLKLWNQLLLHSGGDAERAMEHLERIWEEYGLEQAGISLEDFKNRLEDNGYIRFDENDHLEITGRGEKVIRQDALEEIFRNLRHDVFGNHRTPGAGTGFDNLPETRPYEFGDQIHDIHLPGTIGNALRSSAAGGFRVHEDDIEVFEKEHLSSCSTVLCLDISHSMILYGEDRITPAKKVALALQELIRTRYPKDSLEVVLFGDEAILIPPEELPWVNVGPYHTNTKAALELSEKLLLRRRNTNKQVFLITDGKPSCIDDGGYLYKNSLGLDPKIVNQTLGAARSCRRRGITITTFMIARDPYLKNFVDELSRVNKGNAYYSSLDSLGGTIFQDYQRNRKKRL